MATYFLFLGDLFIVCFFAISFTTAYRYIHLRRKLEDAGCFTQHQIAAKIQRSIYKHVRWLSPRHCGTLPFSFIAWFVYSSFLVAKLCLISGEISHHMYGDGGFNVNQTTISEHGAVEGLNANMLKVRESRFFQHPLKFLLFDMNLIPKILHLIRFFFSKF